MLYEFLTANRSELIERCWMKARVRPGAESSQSEHGVMLFIEQLIKTLEAESQSFPLDGLKVSGPPGGGTPPWSEMGESASQFGRELLTRSFTIDQVVHAYGDVCQAITDLAFELNVPFTMGEFRTLNSCVDNAIAEAVVEFSYQRDLVMAGKAANALHERIGILAHELRNRLHTANLALKAIKSGKVPATGATGAVLDRSLIGLRVLIDRTLADVRVDAGLLARHAVVALGKFIEEVVLSASIEADASECTLNVAPVDRNLAVWVDRDLLLSAVGNLLQNAFKYTSAHSHVNLTAFAVADHIRIEIEDHCGGLPPGGAEHWFDPYRQGGSDRSGMGLGLTIARRSVEANLGKLTVRDNPGSGCVFTIELPRHAVAA